jgi:serine/threonine protein kinase
MRRLGAMLSQPDFSNTRYRLIGSAGAGGMGTVYLAEDTELHRNVAIKVLSARTDSPDFEARLLAEARILANLEHPGIVPVHDAGVLADGRCYYAMKYITGQRLDEYAREPHTIPDRIRIFLRACEPVAFAHSKNIVHRDLKPDNIMTGGFGEVLVLDWGIAKVMGSTDLPQGTIAGTHQFMAPEQSTGDVQNIDHRTDIYALGRILLHLLNGTAAKRPLLAIAAKAAAPDPNARYGSVSALVADLNSFLDGEPVSAYRESPFERLHRLLSRHRTLVTLIAAYLLSRILVFLFTRR